MGEQYIGEIRLFPYNRIPSGWQACNGQLLPIQNNAALFSLISTSFGGDGKTTFGLPDLRGRAIIGAGSGAVGVSNQVGTKGGFEAVTLTLDQMPLHNHTLNGTSSNATGTNASGGYYAVPTPPSTITNPPPTPPVYGSPQSLTPLNAAMIQPTGGGQPHENRQPFIALIYCIAVLGYYPQRS